MYGLAEHCGFGQLHDELIRDRIVVGIRDVALSEKMQMDSKLDLQKAVNSARQSKAVKKQQATLRGTPTSTDNTVDAVRRAKSQQRATSSRGHRQGDRSQYAQQRSTTRSSTIRNSTNKNTCSRCGKSPMHPKQQCLAREAICHHCSKKGHFKSMCRSRNTIGDISDEGEELTFLDTIHLEVAVINGGTKPWTTILYLNGHATEFKIDTGADVTVIPATMYEKSRDGSLVSPGRVLRGPSQHALSVLGKFVGNLKVSNPTVKQDIYVVKGLQRALLGRPAIESLGVAVQVDQVLAHKATVVSKFPHLFKGLGRMTGAYHIDLKQDATPFALTVPRRVAIPLMPKVKSELERMERIGVISRVEVPTDWCAGMVVVPKPDGRVRICVDLTKLNQNVRRERHMLPSVEQTLAQLGGATVFSKLDANSGFWQIELTKESSLLTTFITPFGRYSFNRLPFGITSAPEHFQRRISEILQSLEGVVCLIDDILIYGKTQEEHDKRLTTVLQKIAAAGITLNVEKCEIAKTQVKFLGQLIDKQGIYPDPGKVSAVKNMKAPSNITELHRFLGMINQLGKFIPQLAEATKPLRELLSAKNQWLWSSSQQQAFKTVQAMVSSDSALALFDPCRPTRVSADASSYGLGAVLTQQQPSGEWKSVSYISRSLTATEQRYAQIEKEALAVTWACERFRDFLIGLQFHIHTDHKPLVPLFTTKGLDELPVRIQRFRLRLMRFSYTVSHVPGKHLTVADTLSRAPNDDKDTSDEQFQQEVEAFVNLVLQQLPASESRLKEIMEKQFQDETCQLLIKYCQSHWPERNKVASSAKPYISVANELSVCNGLLLRGDRIVIPLSIRQEILGKLHCGHQGITKCRERARQSVWWPGINKEIETMIQKCLVCCKHRTQHAEPLRPTPFPENPWQKVATDLFEWKKTTYLLVVDYYSRYIEISSLTNTTSKAVIQRMKTIFARHGIPECLMSDNGPQFSSKEFHQFSKEYSFVHKTSSPNYPQANGEAERAVRTVKSLLNKNEDIHLALLAYRSTPLKNGYSPAELLMSRKLRTTIPIISASLQPKLPDNSELRQKEGKMRRSQKKNFDSRHKAQTLEPLLPGETVWLPEQGTEGTVIEESSPRSYTVQTSNGQYRRNRYHIISLPPESNTRASTRGNSPMNHTSDPSGGSIQSTSPPSWQDSTCMLTRSGRRSKPPDRLISSGLI